MLVIISHPWYCDEFILLYIVSYAFYVLKGAGNEMAGASLNEPRMERLEPTNIIIPEFERLRPTRRPFGLFRVMMTFTMTHNVFL